MTNSIKAMFFFLSTLTAFISAIDIGNDNQKITLQADVETLVINLPLSQANRTTATAVSEGTAQRPHRTSVKQH